MIEAVHNFEGDISRAQFKPGEPSLDTAVIIAKLNKLDPGYHADLGSRLDNIHPDIEKRQGLYYWGHHICGMDRGQTPMWPEWNTEGTLVEVPLDYGLKHEDIPLLDFDISKGLSEIPENPMARVMQPRLTSVEKIGWAEVFWKLAHDPVAPIAPDVLGKLFNVPTDWVMSIGSSPVGRSYAEGNKHFVNRESRMVLI